MKDSTIQINEEKYLRNLTVLHDLCILENWRYIQFRNNILTNHRRLELLSLAEILRFSVANAAYFFSKF